MIVMSRTVEIQVMNMLLKCVVWILLTSRMYKMRRSWFGFMAAVLTRGSRGIPSGLLTDGMVVVGVEYRLSPHVKTMEIVDDAAAAVAWVFDNIGKYGGDTSSIYIAGHSAGGYLVDMVGLDKKLLARYGKDADKLAGIIPFSGQVITHFETRNQRGLKPLQPTIDETPPCTMSGMIAPLF